MQWPLSNILFRTDDGSETRLTKKLLLIGSGSGILIFMMSLTSDLTPFKITRRALGLLGCLLQLVQLLVEKKIRLCVTEIMMYMVGASLLLGDLILSVTLSPHRNWPFFVVLIDLCLICKMHSRVAKILIISLVTWLVVLAAENSFRFGLYDFSFLPPQEERTEICDCAELPCANGFMHAVLVTGNQIVVVLLDYYFTRGFAHGLQTEHDKMNQASKAAEDIAASLSRFDLAAAEEIISTASLPPPLYDAFSRILCNLHVYRPFLPQSCLHGESSSGEEVQHDSLPLSDSRYSGSDGDVIVICNIREARSLEKKRCTFTVTNMLGSHKDALNDIIAYQERYRVYMERVLSCYSRVSGVVGVVVGDHVHASFNAARRCANHAKNAVQGAVDLYLVLENKEINVVTGVASGTAYCGPLGCSELMSVTMIGPSVVTAYTLQICARVRQMKIMCDESVYHNIGFVFTSRILLNMVMGQSSTEEAFIGYEVLVETGECHTAADTGEEWMYQLEDMPWDTYNAAGKEYLQGDFCEALRLLGIKKDSLPSVANAERALAEMIRCKISNGGS